MQPDTKTDNTLKRSLILAGGGVRLAYQAGVLQALHESKKEFNHIDGTSGGIFNAAMLASGLGPDEMADRWRKLDIKHFMSARSLKEYFFPGRYKGVGDADGIRNKIFPALGIRVEKMRNNSSIKTTFNVCNFSAKTIEAIPNDRVTEDHLIAGVSLPIFMPAIRIGQHWYSDAVWIKDANLMEAVRRGAEELWLVWAIGNGSEYLNGSFNQYVHMIEMSSNGGLWEEYAQIDLINKLIAQGNSPYGQQQSIKLHVIRPRFPLPLDPDLFLRKIDTSTLIDMGYADAKAYLGNHNHGGVSFDPQSTKMEDPGINLTFRQKYSGTMLFNGKADAIAYSCSFTFRQFVKHEMLSLSSSVYIQSLRKTISCKNNVAEIKIGNKRIALHAISTFEIDGKDHICHAVIPLHSPVDWLLGVEFKKVHIELYSILQSEKVMLAKGWLIQSIFGRLKYLLCTSLNNFSGNGLKLVAMYKAILKLYTV